MHVDMDAYFASIEQRDMPMYRNKPLLVCHADDLSSHRGIVVAASYEAREFGVKAGMSVLEAKLRLPSAIYVAGNYEKYLYTTQLLMQVCEKYSDIMEAYSIDEDSGRQASVFDALNEREATVVSVVDQLKNKYGEKAVTRCSLLGLHGKYNGVPRAEIGIF